MKGDDGMSGREGKVNGVLFGICLALCVASAGFLSESSSAPYVAEPSETSDVILADPARIQEETVREEAAGAKPEEAEAEKEPSQPPEPADESSADPEAHRTSGTAADLILSSPYEVSPEASKGTWVSQGTGWMFMVDEVPYTGWLNDTDGKRYYLDTDGMMMTGWLEEDGKTYYLDADGIMQTGEVQIDGTLYTFDEYGVKTGEEEGASAAEEEEAAGTDSREAKEETAQTASKKNGKTPEQTEPLRHIALTFDDGPSDFTDELLDCLEEYHAHATFFMVGSEIENYPETVKRMLAAGCELGNHTYSHTDLTTLTAGQMQEAIGATDELLLELTGQGASVLRPPYGNVNDLVLSTVGTPMILWSIDTMDWDTRDAQKTINTVKKEVFDGAVILMHDIYEESLEAARTLIPWLIDEGYELLTVHELAAAFNTELTTGTTYRIFGSEL